MRFTTTARLRKGWPRQFWVMWQNMRCSILFHLLVPGGKWHTLIFNPKSSAKPCKQTFHSRDRLLLLLPPTAYRGHGEFRRVVIDAHVHPAFVPGQVIDPVGCHLPFLSRKVLGLD